MAENKSLEDSLKAFPDLVRGALEIVNKKKEDSKNRLSEATKSVPDLARKGLDYVDEHTSEDGVNTPLDFTDVLEHAPIGPTEEERNESRLNHLITGESRPASHVIKEIGARTSAGLADWMIGNAVSGAINKDISKIQRKAGKVLLDNKDAALSGTEGVIKNTKSAIKNKAKDTVREISKDATEIGDLDKGLKKGKFVEADPKKVTKAKNKALKSAKNDTSIIDSYEKLAGKDAKKSLAKIKESLKDVDLNDPEIRKQLNESGLMNDLLNIMDTSIDMKHLQGPQALQSAAVSQVVRKTPNAVVSMQPGEYKDVDGYENINFKNKYNPKIESGFMDRVWNGTKDILDLNNMDPTKYPMDKVNTLLEDLNYSEDGFGKYFHPKQLEGLSDTEKLELLRDIAKGKYNDEYNDNLSYQLYNLYKNGTNNKEDK